jgi:PncC family amidohydrolase
LIARKIQEIFIDNGWTLCLAESCTGGAISSTLVRQPACSQYFLGSIVAYSSLAKIRLLGIHAKTIATNGEVSLETAIEMAEGAQRKLEADFSLAVTGIAGPLGGTSQKPVGTVFFAIIGKKEKKIAWGSQFQGKRQKIISDTTQTGLRQLLDFSLSCRE